MAQSLRSKSVVGRGFTLIELLVVMLIIVLLISIVVPTLGKVRSTAKKTSTKQMVTGLADSAGRFQADQRRWPGYYSPRDMGGSENMDRGMSAMENTLLDLSGGIVSVGGVATTGQIAVAPFDTGGTRKAEVAIVDPKLIGSTAASSATNKGYFVPPTKNFIEQQNVGSQIRQFGGGDAALSLPDLVDDFGTPVLVWNEDETAGPIQADGANNTFARLDSTKTAHFYWASNACFLKATALGRQNRNQTVSATDRYSLLGADSGANAGTKAVNSLGGILGNPGFVSNLGAAPDATKILPTGSRGKFVVEAADPDALYFSNRSKGAGEIADGTIWYGFNHVLPDKKTLRTDEKGQKTSIDVTAKFDDVLVSAGL